jgi:hypothetical protein
MAKRLGSQRLVIVPEGTPEGPFGDRLPLPHILPGVRHRLANHEGLYLHLGEEGLSLVDADRRATTILFDEVEAPAGRNDGGLDVVGRDGSEIILTAGAIDRMDEVRAALSAHVPAERLVHLSVAQPTWRSGAAGSSSTTGGPVRTTWSS